MHPMARTLEGLGKKAHGPKKRNDLLKVVDRIIRLRADFHQHIKTMGIGTFLEPRMSTVQLIATYQPHLFSWLLVEAIRDASIPIHDGVFFRQRSEQ